MSNYPGNEVNGTTKNKVLSLSEYSCSIEWDSFKEKVSLTELRKTYKKSLNYYNKKRQEENPDIMILYRLRSVPERNEYLNDTQIHSPSVPIIESPGKFYCPVCGKIHNTLGYSNVRMHQVRMHPRTIEIIEAAHMVQRTGLWPGMIPKFVLYDMSCPYCDSKYMLSLFDMGRMVSHIKRGNINNPYDFLSKELVKTIFHIGKGISTMWNIITRETDSVIEHDLVWNGLSFSVGGQSLIIGQQHYISGQANVRELSSIRAIQLFSVIVQQNGENARVYIDMVNQFADCGRHANSLSISGISMCAEAVARLVMGNRFINPEAAVFVRTEVFYDRIRSNRCEGLHDAIRAISDTDCPNMPHGVISQFFTNIHNMIGIIPVLSQDGSSFIVDSDRVNRELRAIGVNPSHLLSKTIASLEGIEYTPGDTVELETNA